MAAGRAYSGEFVEGEQEVGGVMTESFFKPSGMALEVDWSKRDSI